MALVMAMTRMVVSDGDNEVDGDSHGDGDDDDDDQHHNNGSNSSNSNVIVILSWTALMMRFMESTRAATTAGLRVRLGPEPNPNRPEPGDFI